MNRRSIVRVVFQLSIALFVIVSMASRVNAQTSTLKNMQAAFNGESNAHARYLAFAKQADHEGYGEVASLFRAAARAEEIHAANHASVIKGLGATPQANIGAPEVKSTRENLEAAIKGETYERDTMYPDFLKQARKDGNSSAVKSLNQARTAEAEHAKLYTAALGNLEHLKGTQSVAFSVCPTCGFTTRNVDFSKCPSCFTAKEKFEKVA